MQTKSKPRAAATGTRWLSVQLSPEAHQALADLKRLMSAEASAQSGLSVIARTPAVINRALCLAAEIMRERQPRD